MANFHFCFGNVELGFLANSAKESDFFHHKFKKKRFKHCLKRIVISL